MGDLHAIVLLLCPVATIVGLLLVRRRTPTVWAGLVAGLLAIVAMVLAVGVNQHACDEGTPRIQWLITGLCLFVVLALVGTQRWRRLAAGLLLVGMFALSCQFTDIAHQRGWTGNPQWPGVAPIWLRSYERNLQEEVIPQLAGDPNDFPAGWLRDIPIHDEIITNMLHRVPARRIVTPVWHSWLTGLYRRRGVEQDVWYPGGKLADGLGRLELRDRTRPTTDND